MKKSWIFVVIACQLLVACSGTDITSDDVVLKSGDITIKSQELYVHVLGVNTHYERHLRIIRGWFEVDQEKFEKKLFPIDHPCASELHMYELVDIRLLDDGTFLGFFDYLASDSNQCSEIRVARIDFRKHDIKISPIEVDMQTLNFNDETGRIQNRGWGVFYSIDNKTRKLMYRDASNDQDSRVAEYHKFLRQKENDQWLVLYNDTKDRPSIPQFTYVINPKSGKLINLGQGELIKMENGFFLMARDESDRMLLWTTDTNKKIHNEKQLMFRDVNLNPHYLGNAKITYSMYLDSDAINNKLAEEVRDAQLVISGHTKPEAQQPPAQTKSASPDFAISAGPMLIHNTKVDFNNKRLSGNALLARNQAVLEQLKELNYEIGQDGNILITEKPK
jgi:hypothetical protein